MCTSARRFSVFGFALYPVYNPGFSIDFETPTEAPIITSSQMEICPTMPDCPPIMQRFPILVEPAIPTCAAITVSSPMVTLCAICTWLRSEEHTSELQSRENLVCRLLLEKKNT